MKLYSSKLKVALLIGHSQPYGFIFQMSRGRSNKMRHWPVFGHGPWVWHLLFSGVWPIYYIEAFKILNFQSKQSQKFWGSLAEGQYFMERWVGALLEKKVQKLSLGQF